METAQKNVCLRYDFIADNEAHLVNSGYATWIDDSEYTNEK